MKKKTKLVLKWLSKTRVQLHYSNLVLDWATISISDINWKVIEVMECSKNEVMEYIIDWVVARWRGYDVD